MSGVPFQMRPSLQQAIAAVQQLPSLSATTHTVLTQLNDPSADALHVAQAIARDQGLVTRVLRVANSPFFGLSSQVQSIHEAVMVVGMSNLRMMVTAALLTAQKFPGLAIDGQVQRLFRHGVAVAICAASIARRKQLNQHLMFLAGILHDVGKLALQASYPALHDEMQRLRQSNNLLSFDAEQQVFGFNHAAIGAALCRHWHLPEAIAFAVQHHHALDGQHGQVLHSHALATYAEVIHLADAVALGLNLEAESAPPVPPASELAWNRWMDPREELDPYYAEVRQLYQELVVLVDNSPQ